MWYGVPLHRVLKTDLIVVQASRWAYVSMLMTAADALPRDLPCNPKVVGSIVCDKEFAAASRHLSHWTSD